MELECKFIEDTNEQYSIRNDGVVISHFKRHRGGISPFIVPKVLIPLLHKNAPYHNLCINSNIKHVTVRSLLKQYFGGVKCLSCDTKIQNNYYCKECKKAKNRLRTSLWASNNVESVRKHKANTRVKTIGNLTRAYVATMFKISVNELPEDLYQIKKELILFKRQVCNDNNISIQTFNKLII